jgi:quinoprotein dehydrogenase-associated probable ABC transporter substrate-binding protein
VVLAADPAPLRVCADPDNLPFSNDRQQGFENAIARLVADDLHATLQYTWFSQQNRGFLRQTLQAGKCDLVVGVPHGYDPVLSTSPYYRSTYVFVYRKDRGLNLQSFDDPVLRKLRIGLHAYGSGGSNAPPANALARRGLSSNVVGYSILATADSPPGKIFKAVAQGEVDVAIVWGPLVGGFVREQSPALVVVPVDASREAHPLQFAFDMSMGVRRDDQDRRQQLEGVLLRRRGDIRNILQSHDVPMVDTDSSRAVSPVADAIVGP